MDTSCGGVQKIKVVGVVYTQEGLGDLSEKE